MTFKFKLSKAKISFVSLSLTPHTKTVTFKVALGVCFALKTWKEYLLLFTYLITLGKDVTLPLIKQASE